MAQAQSTAIPRYDFSLLMPKLIELLRPLPERIWNSSLRQSQPFVVGLTRCFLAKTVLQCQAIVLLYDQQLIVIGEPVIRSLIETLVHMRFVYRGFCGNAPDRVEAELARLQRAEQPDIRTDGALRTCQGEGGLTIGGQRIDTAAHGLPACIRVHAAIQADTSSSHALRTPTLTKQPRCRRARAGPSEPPRSTVSKMGQSPTRGLPHIDRQNGCPAGSA